ncbi:MAG: SDR family NAD(P)-dependent oxidoreductase [Thermodesulfovibrionales bacterium]|nr:SDR family NAD(P)-dependent oxidoreductase [Thermodesulfovibrionales bacterium]
MKKAKKILITGAGGFIGSHLVEKCLKSGASVRAFVRYNSRNHWGWLDDPVVRGNCEIICGDIRDFDSVSRAMEDCGTVFHLAALIGIPYSYVSPLAYIKTNIEGTYNVLEACRKQQPDNIVITSTSEVYGTAQYVPIDEKHPLIGQSPYSASKIAADQLALSYCRSFSLPVKIVRPFNTFGPRQSARAVIPNLIIQMLKGEKKLRVGNLTPTRDFTYVEDTVAGFIEIAACEKLIGEVTNIGMGNEISIEDLAKMIAAVLGVDVPFAVETQRVRPEASEVERLLCDNAKIKVNTDWQPRFTLEAGIEKTIAWIKGNLAIFKSELYNV